MSDAWKILTGKHTVTERQKREIEQLQMALISIQYGRLRKEYPERSDAELSDQAAQTLADKGILHKGLLGLRYELQCELCPAMMDLFDVFQKIDQQLPDLDDETYRPTAQHQDLLLQDYEETLREQLTAPDSQGVFLRQKRLALETLLSFHGCVAFDIQLPWENGVGADAEWCEQTDAFGYNGAKATPDILRAIRYHQTYNLCRASLLKEKLGFSVLAFQSSQKGAGRGVFVDGQAPCGALLCFVPGQVWPKEYLTNLSESLRKHFEESTEMHQLSLRGDDILIDSRSSPYTVITNPWALGHVVNHGRPNTRAVSLNILERMELKEKSKYVPNRYARQPSILGGNALNQDVVTMHSIGLLTARPLCNEEIFYDYRLQGEDLPDWYTIIEGEDEQ